MRHVFSHSRKAAAKSRVVRVLLWLAAIMLLLPAAVIALYAVVPPPLTPLMAMRWFDGAGLRKEWVPLSRVAPHVPRAVIASEDNLFCEHAGFDWRSIGEAVEDYSTGRRMRGASTISMQTAKNLFLWPGRDLARKSIEAYLTVLIELIWSKQRIMEVYLNIAEWGDGVYGIGAAARAYFGKPAGSLTQREAALLAAVLPNPREWSPVHPSAYISGRADIIMRRIGQLGPLLACVASR
jgi:monofunctional biosynthetic peptidoglycan transglycosylase